jgi:hypothetical protein
MTPDAGSQALSAVNPDGSVTAGPAPNVDPGGEVGAPSVTAWNTGTASGTSEGTGHLVVSIAHGLGVTPRFVAIETSAYLTSDSQHAVTAKDAITFTVDLDVGVGFYPVQFDWAAFR